MKQPTMLYHQIHSQSSSRLIWACPYCGEEVTQITPRQRYGAFTSIELPLDWRCSLCKHTQSPENEISPILARDFSEILDRYSSGRKPAP